MQLSAGEESAEATNGELLAQFGNVDTETAIRVLRKHKGDMEKAVDALLAGDRGETSAWESKHRTTPEPKYSDGRSTAVAPHPSSSVIDLTGDGEEDLSRAIQMSIQDGPAVQFGPSDRAPHPDWQMVRSNVPVASSTHDPTLDDAIQASLQDFGKEDEEMSDPSAREGGRPIALRQSAPAFVYATLALHALFHVPQARAALSTIRIKDNPTNEHEKVVRDLIDLFTNLDLAQISFMVDTEVAPSVGIPPFDPSKPLSAMTAFAFRAINYLIEEQMKEQAADPDEAERLFSFTHGRITLDANGCTSRIDRFPESGAVVALDYGGDNLPNDLISCMEYILVNPTNNGASYDVILTPSDVIAFPLARLPNTPSSKSPPDPFDYPKSLYLDRFLFHNLEMTNEKRRIKRKMEHELQELKNQRETLTRFNERDTLADLRSTLYYYENIAEKGDESRLLTLERTTNQLKDILLMVTAKVEDIDHRLEKLQAEIAVIFDCPELQEFRYDLRAVLMHTGLPGRKQLYSYVQDIEGVWWKTLDKDVVEVPEETVLTDPTGLHLGAGPYLLLYSRHLTDEQLREPLVWPTIFSEAVEENNRRFLAAVHPELGIFQNSSSEGHSPMKIQENNVDTNQAVAGIEGEPTWSMSLD